jgi:hypothetical protein
MCRGGFDDSRPGPIRSVLAGGLRAGGRVLFVGLNSPVVAPLFRARPVLGLCVHSVQPMAPMDVWLTATSSISGQWAAWGPLFPLAWGHYHPYRIALKPLGGLITRADLGAAEDSLVLVTVGARLGSEISPLCSPSRKVGFYVPRVTLITQKLPPRGKRGGAPPVAISENDRGRLRCVCGRLHYVREPQ